MCERGGEGCPSEIGILALSEPMEDNLLIVLRLHSLSSQLFKNRDTVSLLDCLNPNVAILQVKKDVDCFRKRRERKAETDSPNGTMGLE